MDNKTPSKNSVVFRYVPTTQHLESQIFETVGMLLRADPALRHGSRGQFATMANWAAGFVRCGVRFLLGDMRAGEECYAYEALLARAGLGALAWACGCLATALAAALAGAGPQVQQSANAVRRAARNDRRAVFATRVAVAAFTARGLARGKKTLAAA